MTYPVLTLIKTPETPKNIVSETDLAPIKKSLKGVVEPRRTGTFEGKAYWLSDEFDWQIGRDNTGELVLIPLKKKE